MPAHLPRCPLICLATDGTRVAGSQQCGCYDAAVEPVDLAAKADEFDVAVAASPAVDKFCSTAAWVLSASAALMPARTPYTFAGPRGFFAAMRGVHPTGFPYIEPLELAWGLAAPIIGGDATGVAEDVAGLLSTRSDWQVAILSGHSANSPQHRALLRAIPPRWERRRGTPTVRHVASLEGGLDGFLSRRSRELRKSLRKTERAATAAGVTFESVACTSEAAAALYDRIQAVEAHSWKTRDGVGIHEGPMREFYRLMLPRLCQTGQQRTVFARQGDRDVGYILGAVFEDEYRGLQFSYHDDLAALGLGSLLQLAQVRLLVEEGVARYDLGTEMDYKRRWAEGEMVTEMLVLVR